MTNSSEFKIWSYIKYRCLNPNSKHYADYGGRGIRIHEPWINDFMAFYEYMGARPGPEYSIDRIDNDGHYEPGNIRWATREQQANNRRNNVKIQLSDGRLVSPKEVYTAMNMNKGTFHSRIANGIPIDQPLRIVKKGAIYRDKFMSWDELSAIHGIPAELIRKRISLGMDIDEAVSMPKQEAFRWPYRGQRLTIPEIAKIEKLPERLLRKHISKIDPTRDAVSNAVNFIRSKYFDSSGQRLGVKVDHGLRNEPGYGSWNKMKDKCYNQNNRRYKYWGAKGATVCDRWKHSFPNFYADMGPKPSKDHYLKVLDLTKPIGPGNAVWDHKSNQVRKN